LDWHPERILTFSNLILGVIKARTVKIKELAVYVESKGNLHAKIIKIERLFLNQVMDFSIFGKIILRLFFSGEKFKLAIDRTNWQFGSKNLNFFVASIIRGNISIPIAWILLDKKGNSSTEERKELIKKILQILPKEQIEIILADREFVGEDWLEYLILEDLPFAVRVKKNERILHKNGGKMQLCKFFRDMHVGTYKKVETRIYNKKINIKMTCLQLEKEQLLIASNVVIGEDALNLYKQRWTIERTFRSLKTAGFNLEDTHITDLNKLEKLFAIVSLSLAICVIAGEIKKHGYRAVSLFTYGLNSMFKLLRERINGAFLISVG
jgi:hypothetical protein